MADVAGVIRERLAEIDSEKGRLEAALMELTGRKRGRGRRRQSSSVSRRTGRTRHVKRGERPRHVLAHLAKNPGARPSEIATAIKASPNQVHAVITKLRKDRTIRKRGQGYGLARAAESSSAKSPSASRAPSAKPSKARAQDAKT